VGHFYILTEMEAKKEVEVAEWDLWGILVMTETEAKNLLRSCFQV